MPERSLSPQRLAYLRAQKRRRRVVLALQVLLLAAFLGWWELAARCGWVDAFIVSSPSRVVRTLAALQSSGELWLHIGTSCLEVVAGFLLGTLLGTLIAIGLWWSELLSRVLDPYLVVLNALPKTALGPVFIVWIGAGTGSIIAMTVAISLFVTILNMHVGFLSTDREKIRLMQTLGATRHQILWRLVIPANYAVQYAACERRPVVGRRHHGRISGVQSRSRLSDRLRVAGVQHGPCDGDRLRACGGGRGDVSACAVAGKGIQKTVGSDAMKRFLCGVLAVLLLVALCACGTQETATVRLSEVTHSVFYAPQYVALEQGFFADEGLKIELSNGGGADKVMTAVLTGQADIGLAGPEACIYVYNQGKDDHPVVFGQLTKRDGSFLVGREDVPFSWELLRGRTVIGGRAGGVPEMTLEYVMRQNGIVPGVNADVDTTVQFNMMAGAFTGGNGDFVTLFEPTATEVAQAGKGYILASVGQESGEIPYTAYFASQTYIREHADVVQRFTNAVARALTWIAEHDAAETAAIIAPQFPDTDVSVLTQVVQRYKDIDAWNATPVMAQSSLERLETVMETAGVLEHADWVDFDRLVDNSYARNAAR